MLIEVFKTYNIFIQNSDFVRNMNNHQIIVITYYLKDYLTA